MVEGVDVVALSISLLLACLLACKASRAEADTPTLARLRYAQCPVWPVGVRLGH